MDDSAAPNTPQMLGACTHEDASSNGKRVSPSSKSPSRQYNLNSRHSMEVRTLSSRLVTLHTGISLIGLYDQLISFLRSTDYACLLWHLYIAWLTWIQDITPTSVCSSSCVCDYGLPQLSQVEVPRYGVIVIQGGYYGVPTSSCRSFCCLSCTCLMRPRSEIVAQPLHFPGGLRVQDLSN